MSTDKRGISISYFTDSPTYIEERTGELLL